MSAQRPRREGNWWRPPPDAILPALAVTRRALRKPVEPIGDPSDRHSLECHIGEFLEDSAVRGFSPHTIAARRRSVRRLQRWLAERGVTRTNEVTKPMLDRYQRHLFHYRKPNGQPLTFLTQKNWLMPLRAFFSWATKTNRILYNPAADIEMPRVEHRLPKHVLTAAEVEAVVGCCDLGQPLGLRNRAILETFYATGIRRGELMRLQLFDLDIDRRALTVRLGKGKRDRVVPLTERAVAWLLRYLDDIRPRLVVDPDPGWVFLAIDGEPLSPNALTVLVSRHVEAADVGKSGSCHLFRHTMATLLLEGGADIRHIQAILGHARLDTTEVYTRVAVGALLQVVDSCHPGARNEATRDPELGPDELPTDPDPGDVEGPHDGEDRHDPGETGERSGTDDDAVAVLFGALEAEAYDELDSLDSGENDDGDVDSSLLFGSRKLL